MYRTTWFSMGALAVVVSAASACVPGPAVDQFMPPLPDDTCTGWYGAPSERTGLSADMCRPEIEGETMTWQAPSWTEEDLSGLMSWYLVEPYAVPTDDPYVATPDIRPAAGVCALVIEDERAKRYRLRTYPSVDEAAAARAIPTHGGACGLCSTLQDLAVYAGIPDLTSPVRACGLEGVFGSFEDNLACLMALGFSAPCAQIWGYNTRHTRDACSEPCFALLGEPYHTSDGELNECLQCDEDVSGPVFQAVAGRTRRNTGLATALCRRCETVWRLEHEYR